MDVPQSKWNMDEICGFHLSYVSRYATGIFLEISPCRQHVVFITEFVLLLKTPPFYEVWDIPCIARVMVWISYPGGGSKVSQQAVATC